MDPKLQQLNQQFLQLSERLAEARQNAKFLKSEFESLESAGIARIFDAKNLQQYEKAINEVSQGLRRLQGEENTLAKTSLLQATTLQTSGFNNLSQAVTRYISKQQQLQQTIQATAAAQKTTGPIGGVIPLPGQAPTIQAPSILQNPNLFKSAASSINFFTSGTVTPESTGVFASTSKLVDATQKAIDEIKKQYAGAGDLIEKSFTARIDQATGRITVQGELSRKLTNGVNQISTVSATADPFTGETTAYSPSQQAFIQQAGGIERARQMLARYGLEVNSVTGFYKDLNSNVARFSVLGRDGISTSMGNMDQFGNATLHAARNAQTLVQNIERNITKVIEWAAATGLVYAIMNSLFTAAKELDDIQETMADISIATGAAGEELQKYYDSALAVANLTGVDVTQTLEAQSKAYRAAGDSANRFRTANVLLRDSMILARLSGMDQAASLDTLVAALRQTGRSLEDGTSLLDKWVRTTQNAGVSLQDLSQSFAITADVADTVGVGVDELNGIIAVLAEKTILSSTEIGNALRTMFANITSDEAVKTLGEFGIAVRDTNGEMRSWLDITQNIVDLMNAGLLNDEQINRLANALGGGSRRGPQLIALWQNFGRVGELAAESMDANGEAATAMDIKLQTLTAAINELHNAFNELVQTLGFEGGFLELLTESVKIITDLVRSINSLAESFEGGAASVASFLLIYAGLQRVLGKVDWQSAVGGPRQRTQLWPGQSVTTGGSALGSAVNFMGQQGGPWYQRGAQGLGPGLAISAGEIARGIAGNESWDRVGVRVGATLAGSFVGNMLLPGAGGLIGGFIADAFVNELQGKADIISEVRRGETADLSPTEIQERINSLTSGSIFSRVLQQGISLTRSERDIYNETEINQILQRAIQSGAFQRAPELLGGRMLEPSRREREQYFEEQGFEGSAAKILARTDITANQLDALNQLYEELAKATQEETEAHQQVARQLSVPQTTLNISELFQGPQGQALKTAFAGQRAGLAEKAALTGSTDYLKQAEAMDQVLTLTASVAVAQGDANLATKEYIELGNTLLSVTDEERTRIITLSSAINDLTAGLERAQQEGATGWELQGPISEVAQLRAELEELLTVSGRAADIRMTREAYRGFARGPQGAEGQALTTSEAGFDEALAAAREAQEQYAEFLGLDPELLRASVTEPLILAFADGYQEVEGLTGDFSQFLMDRMKETAEEMKNTIEFTFKDLRDVSASVIDSPAFASRLKYFENLLQNSFGGLGYDEEKQNVGLLLEGNETRHLNTTMTALNLVLEELVEVEKKQLEGVWNLPSGMTAYVPITSLFYQQQQSPLGGGGAGGGSPYNTGVPVGLESGSTKISQGGDKMLTAANIIHEAAVIQRNQIIERERILSEADRPDSRTRRLTPGEMDRRSGFEQRESSRVNVEITPQPFVFNIDGRAVATSMARYQSRILQSSLRSGGGTNKSFTVL